MDGRPVSLRIAGQSFKVVSSASDEELTRLAQTISAKVEELGHDTRDASKSLSQAVLLAAISLAHELEEERARRVSVESRARDMLQRVLGQIDDAIDSAPASDCAPEQ